jgi:hypothetical protein
MDAGDHQVEAAKDIAGIIEAPVVEDIALYTFEYGKGGQFAVDLVNLKVLFADPVLL